jgi:hypothetical protein
VSAARDHAAKKSGTVGGAGYNDGKVTDALSRLSLYLLLIAAVLALGLIMIGFMPQATWDGAFSLAIQPQSKSGREIVAVSYLAMPTVEHALAQLEHASSKEGFVDCEKKDGFVAHLPTYGKRNAYGIDTYRGEWKCAVIIAKYADGSEATAIVEAPAGRGARTVVAKLP